MGTFRKYKQNVHYEIEIFTGFDSYPFHVFFFMFKKARQLIHIR